MRNGRIWSWAVVVVSGCAAAFAWLDEGVRAAADVEVLPFRPVPGELTGWKAGPRSTRACIDSGRFAGAIVLDDQTVDIAMRGGARFRLFLGRDCPPFGYYSGIYYKPSRPGKVCAGADRVMSRAGSSCRVRAIATLTPVAD
jgi:hypothetical protein